MLDVSVLEIQCILTRLLLHVYHCEVLFNLRLFTFKFETNLIHYI